jgi:predicted short-subunit dehydrogenase-like oxidoreductase (DUF2520 family)
MKLNIIGAGQVGRVLGRLLHARAGWQIGQVLNRSLASAEQAVEFIGAGQPIADWQALQAADVTLLAVGDDQIEAACLQLAALAQPVAGVVFHCSGALCSTVLNALRARGAHIASVHPIRSFADAARVANQFDGTFCSMEGDAAALAVLEPALQAIGARLIAMDPDHKTLYHAAAVLSCNYLNTLLDAALRTWQAAGIAPDTARAIMAPLVQETLDNIVRLGPMAALTGPVARGDLATVARHQAALDEWDQPTGQLYRLLAEQTAVLAARKNQAD